MPGSVAFNRSSIPDFGEISKPWIRNENKDRRKTAGQFLPFIQGLSPF